MERLYNGTNQDLRSYTIHGGKGALRFANTPYWTTGLTHLK